MRREGTQQIAGSILDGRPNGMPAFRGRIPGPQVLQLVAYVRALGGLAPKVVVSARSDHMQPRQRRQAAGR